MANKTSAKGKGSSTWARLSMVGGLLVIILVAGYLLSAPRDGLTAAYSRLYYAVKSKDTEAIKSQLTKKSIEFGEFASQQNKTPLEKTYENGFTATTFAASLPQMRDERIDGDMGALEVWNSKDHHWEDLPFIKEDGVWKLAVGEMFAGTYKSPGPGRDQIEKQAANAAANSNVAEPPTSNANAPIIIQKPNPIPPDKSAGSKK